MKFELGLLLPFNSTIVTIHLKARGFPVTVYLCSMRDLWWMTLRPLEYKELLTQICKTGTKQDNRREIWGTKRLHIECRFRQIINMQQNVRDDHFSTTREYLRLFLTPWQSNYTYYCSLWPKTIQMKGLEVLLVNTASNLHNMISRRLNRHNLTCKIK